MRVLGCITAGIILSWAGVVHAQDSQPSGGEAEKTDTVQTSQAGEVKPHVRYKSGKDVNFDQLLIQGELKRPDVTVVTGNTGQGNEGLLRLRQNFLDKMSVDSGEEIKK